MAHREHKHWTHWELQKEALRYENRSDFQNLSYGAYRSAMRKGILYDICIHMNVGNKPISTWSFEELHCTALKYSNRNQFKNNATREYQACRALDIIEKVCSHMTRGKHGFDIDKPALLYYVRVDGGVAYKIGITNQTVKIRFKNDIDKITLVKTWEYVVGFDAYEQEQKILKEFNYAKWTGDDLLIYGNSELLTHDVLGLDLEVTT